jgi:hypothetical protein
MNILVLCQEDNHRKLLPAYARALRAQGAQMAFADPAMALDAPLDEILARCEMRPDWIFHVESDFPLLPRGLAQSRIPTMCFHVDTYAFTRRRIRWSGLFDGVAVFHPGYERIFAKSGHPGAFVLPHAVQRELYDRPEKNREFEIAWVGTTAGPIYRRRRKWLPKLAAQFRMNDWKRGYTLAEVADIYQRSRIVVNLGRDDFPQDANMRVYEAMAAGALLITSAPTELTGLGFKEGTHFVAYRGEEELIPAVRHYLDHEDERSKIAAAGRGKTLREDTYDCRAARLLQVLSGWNAATKAPARSWPEWRVRLAYIDFFAAQGLIGLAAAEFRKLNGQGFRANLEGAMLLSRAWLKHRIGEDKERRE